mmetsp:Transcript_27886/g.37246  ORF Transcript_27886/g.37246 Transcript_27886/m.37246 type:complete len:207 (+) Transcript_27886:354-974(+)
MLSSVLLAVKATTAQFFLCTSVPRRALPFTMQKGTFILRQRAGSQTTSSMGSTSWAMTTMVAFFCSIRVVTCLRPYLRTAGGAPEVAFSPLAAAAAACSRRSALASLVSGRYLTRTFRSSAAWFLSTVRSNMWIAGGTFSLWSRIFFCLWKRTFLGHLTKRERSRPVPRTSPPIRRFLGLAEKRGLATAAALGFAVVFALAGILEN